MILLAHRGLWRTPAERNTRGAFRAAFALGFGVELDVRDQAGALVVSHDMAVGECLPLADVLTDYRDAGMPGRLALNIKADGLAQPLAALLAGFPGMAARSFVFDMSVPDMLAYLRTDLPVFTRHSEYEPLPALEARTAGTWLDCFVAPWVDPARVVAELARGRGAAIVSPELHARTNHREAWALLRDTLARAALPADARAGRLMLCTDHPVAAAACFAAAADAAGEEPR